MLCEPWLFLLLGGTCLSGGSCLMGRPNCLVFPSHLFCPSSWTERTWKVENVLANVPVAAPPQAAPGDCRKRGPRLTCCSSASSPTAFIKPLVSMCPSRRMYRGRPSLQREGTLFRECRREGRSKPDENSPSLEMRVPGAAHRGPVRPLLTDTLPVPQRG